MDHIPSTHLDQGKYAFIYTQQENSLQKKPELKLGVTKPKKRQKASQCLSLTLVTFKKIKQLLGQIPKGKFSEILMYLRGFQLMSKCQGTLDRVQWH